VQTIVRSAPIAASNTLALTHEAIASYGLDSTMALVSSATGGLGKSLISAMTLSQAYSTAGSQWLRSSSSTMAMSSSAGSYNTNDRCGRRNSPSGPVARGRLTLHSNDGQYSITLRNPEIDNVRRSAFDRIVRESRNGKLFVYRDANWNVIQTLLYTIVAEKRVTLDSLQTFFLSTLGNEITLIDWLGEEWTGVITTPDEIATEDREGYWTFSFTFEGSKNDAHSGSQFLNLSQEATQVLV